MELLYLLDSSTDIGLRIKTFSGVTPNQLVVYAEARAPSRFQMLSELITKTRY